MPEIELGVFVQIMKTFGILSDYTVGSYKLRLTGPPYNSFVQECKSIAVYGHNRGTKLSPLHIRSVLTKFDISEEDYLRAVRDFVPERPQPPPEIPN